MKRLLDFLKANKRLVTAVIGVAAIAVIGVVVYAITADHTAIPVGAAPSEPPVAESQIVGSSDITSSAAVSESSQVVSSQATTTTSSTGTTTQMSSKGGTTTTTTPTTSKAPQTPPSTGTGGTPSQTPPPDTTPTKKQLIVPNDSQLSVIENEIVRLVNIERANVGVGPLSIGSKLMQAADIRVGECYKYFSHTRPDGTLWSTILDEVQYGTRVEQQESSDGVNWHTVVVYDSGVGAENLTGQGYDDNHGFTATDAELKQAAKDIVNTWKNSSGHYKAMINGTYTKTGVGARASLETLTDGSGGQAVFIDAIQIFTEK